MAKGKRKVPEINSSSTADIAFLLLIFFLVTTSMDTDRGLARRLPPPPEQDQQKDDIKLKERNVLQVFLNMHDQLMCGDDYVTVDQLRDTMVTTNHVISLRCDRGSTYQAYISVQNELVAAYNELRDELAENKFGKKYVDLGEDEQAAIREIYPQKISEAEPRKYGEKK